MKHIFTLWLCEQTKYAVLSNENLHTVEEAPFIEQE
jgi:hypothetical protein